MFYFVRHGKTDYSGATRKFTKALASSCPSCLKKAWRRFKRLLRMRGWRMSDLILSTPYTRAVQTAAILSKQLGLDLVIETDLHEWLANEDYTYEDDETAERAYEEYVRNCGRHASETQTWEEATAIRERVIREY